MELLATRLDVCLPRMHVSLYMCARVVLLPRLYLCQQFSFDRVCIVSYGHAIQSYPYPPPRCKR